MTRIIAYLSPAALALFLVACSSTPAIDMSGPIDANDVLRLVAERNAAIRALEGYGSISIDSPELSNSGSISMKMLKPDSLQIDISGPFGVTVARSLITSRSFMFYDGFNNTVVEGPTTSDNLRRVLRVGLEFGDILSILSGAIALPERTGEGMDSYRDNDRYVFIIRDDAGSREYSVNLNYLAVQRFIRRDLAGDITEEVNYRDYRRKSGHTLPHVISISRPMYEESLSLVFQNQTVNDYPVTFTFSAPRSAKRVFF
jgi:outer membrane biogenesis lipoprotein LolB